MGVRASLYPAVKELGPNWWEDPKRADEIVGLFNKIVLGSDSASNLAATGLVTNAYLYTGDEKYKRWVLEYVAAWMDRIEQNNGIIPDNVGPTGKPGELHDGVWWGTIYGWNSYVGWSHIFHSIAIALECALLLTADYRYLDLLRSQVKMLLDNSITDENGALLVPNRATPDGFVHGHVEPNKWDATSSTTLRLYELAHLYHASMSQEDYDLIAFPRGTAAFHMRSRRCRHAAVCQPAQLRLPLARRRDPHSVPIGRGDDRYAGKAGGPAQRHVVALPTDEMRQAMMRAEVGDDAYAEDGVEFTVEVTRELVQEVPHGA